MSPAGDRQIPKCTGLFMPGQYKDYIQKLEFFILTDPLSDLRPDLEASGCRDFAIVNIL
jgi:hypothetical protein